MSEVQDVLITVKTAPNPSKQYGDTVCVAGVLLGDSPQWVRLYPVPFRWLQEDKQFKKYEVVSTQLRPAARDARAESMNPNLDEMKRSEPIRGWAARYELLQDLPLDTVCGLIAGVKSDINAQSLGWVKPLDIDIKIEPHKGWTSEEMRKMQAYMELEQSALIPRGHIPDVLVAPRFKVSYSFRCESARCGGHNSQILDWELSEFQRKSSGISDDELKSNIRKKFLDMMHHPARDSRLFVGNLANPVMRHNFSVLGVFYPTQAELTKHFQSQDVLF